MITAALGLVTPTGVLVYDGPPHTEEWFAVRRSGITATDVPAITGDSRYTTARHVYLDKHGALPDLGQDENEAALWGTVLEEPVAQVWAQRHAVTVNPVGILARVGVRHHLASLDRLVEVCPDGDGAGVCGLEVKTRSAFVAGSWRDDIPDDVLAQVLWQLHVTGLPHMHIACLIGGQRLVEFRVDAAEDAEVIAFVVEQVERVWACIERHVMPDVDPTPALGRLLDALHPDRSGDAVIDADKAAALVGAYRDAAAAEKAAVAAKDVARVALVDAMGAAARLLADDEDGQRLVATYLPRSRTTVSAKVLRSDPELWERVTAAGAVTEPRWRQIALTN